MVSTQIKINRADEDKLLACIHCGLCLEACPTYLATGDENDSPRGRIYLMRAVAEGRLANDSPSYEKHIDRCLGCRACEAVCPAGVEYGQLLETSRAGIMQARSQRSGTHRLFQLALKHVWLKPKRLRAAFALARLFRNAGGTKLVLKTRLARAISPQFEFALALLDSSRYRTTNGSARGTLEKLANPKKIAGANPANEERVFLFKGCVTEGLFKQVNEATVRTLEVNACRVQQPPRQVCCGALHAHAGDLAGARTLARQNIEAFSAKEAGYAPPVVTNAGGCGAMLSSYAHLLADDEEFADRARRFSSRIRDIGQQLEAVGFRQGASIGSQCTTYDASCHLLHGQHGADASLRMLLAIPDLNFTVLQDNNVCCGAAGIYNLMEPKLSGQVLGEKLKHIKQSGAQVLTTGNVGCHMQIAGGASLAGIELQVCHPVELLDESYQRAGLYGSKVRP